MLNTCNELTFENNIKYGFKEKESEIGKISGIKIEVRSHLGN